MTSFLRINVIQYSLLNCCSIDLGERYIANNIACSDSLAFPLCSITASPFHFLDCVSKALQERFCYHFMRKLKDHPLHNHHFQNILVYTIVQVVRNYISKYRFSVRAALPKTQSSGAFRRGDVVSADTMFVAKRLPIRLRYRVVTELGCRFDIDVVSDHGEVSKNVMLNA